MLKLESCEYKRDTHKDPGRLNCEIEVEDIERIESSKITVISPNRNGGKQQLACHGPTSGISVDKIGIHCNEGTIPWGEVDTIQE